MLSLNTTMKSLICKGATKVRETLITDALQYLDSLARESSGDALLSTELGQAYLRIGNIQGGAFQGNTGDTEAAIASYRKALNLFEQVAQTNSSSLDIKAHLSETHKKLGLALRRAADKTANAHFQTAVTLNEELLAARPDDNAQKIQMAQAYVNLCRVLPKGLAAGESVETCQRALPLLQTVYLQTPSDKAVLSEMQTTENILGIQFGIMADGIDKETEAEKAKEFYRAAADHFQAAAQNAEKLALVEPSNAIYRRQVFGTRLNESTARLNSGESETALQIQQSILKNAENEAAADGENVQAQQDVASTLSQIGLTYTTRREFSSALIHFKKALSALDRLIAKDAANSELQQDYFNNYIYSGDALSGQRDYESAKKSYRDAFEFAQTAPKLKDSPFVRFAEGMMHEKIGTCLMIEAENAPPNGDRQRKYQAAREEFQKALIYWQDKESAPGKFGLSDELIATAQQKFADCEKKSAL
jgi:non-specific serine/threonine protein kinase/serine/threonine-protein kinase